MCNAGEEIYSVIGHYDGKDSPIEGLQTLMLEFFGLNE
jgi:hypothetical protein